MFKPIIKQKIFKDACSCECMTYLTYLATTQYLWHSCMNMWMHVHGIKTRKHRMNLNLTCEEQINKQACETETLEAWKHKKETKQDNRWKQKQNNQIKIKVSRQRLTHARTHNQAYVHKQDYAHASPCPENLTKQK